MDIRVDPDKFVDFLGEDFADDLLSLVELKEENVFLV